MSVGPAVVTLTRGTLLWGASCGVGVMALYSNSDGLKDLMGVLARATAHHLTRPKYDSGGAGGGGGPHQMSSTAGDPALERQFEKLALDIEALREARVASTGGVLETFVDAVGWRVICGAGIVAFVYYSSGLRFGDLMYVTKGHFTKTVATIQTGVRQLGTALTNVRNDLSRRISIVELKVDQSREEVKAHIDEEVAKVQGSVETLGEEIAACRGEVQGIAQSQDLAKTTMETMEGRLGEMQEKIEDARQQIYVANRGIALLCGVVGENHPMAVPVAQSSTPAASNNAQPSWPPSDLSVPGFKAAQEPRAATGRLFSTVINKQPSIVSIQDLQRIVTAGADQVAAAVAKVDSAGSSSMYSAEGRKAASAPM